MIKWYNIKTKIYFIFKNESKLYIYLQTYLLFLYNTYLYLNIKENNELKKKIVHTRI